MNLYPFHGLHPNVPTWPMDVQRCLLKNMGTNYICMKNSMESAGWIPTRAMKGISQNFPDSI